MLGMLCLCSLSPVQWVNWAELEGCHTRIRCSSVFFSGVPALLAKAEESAWKRIALEDRHVRRGSTRGKSH